MIYTRSLLNLFLNKKKKKERDKKSVSLIKKNVLEELRNGS